MCSSDLLYVFKRSGQIHVAIADIPHADPEAVHSLAVQQFLALSGRGGWIEKAFLRQQFEKNRDVGHRAAPGGFIGLPVGHRHMLPGLNPQGRYGPAQQQKNQNRQFTSVLRGRTDRSGRKHRA